MADEVGRAFTAAHRDDASRMGEVGKAMTAPRQEGFGGRALLKGRGDSGQAAEAVPAALDAGRGQGGTEPRQMLPDADRPPTWQPGQQ